jgi:hypothetical protein
MMYLITPSSPPAGNDPLREHPNDDGRSSKLIPELCIMDSIIGTNKRRREDDDDGGSTFNH